MASSLKWKVPTRAQSARAPTDSWPSDSTSSSPGQALPNHPPTTIKSPQPANFNRCSLGSAPPRQRPPGSAPPAPTSHGALPLRSHKYWELGGLGPAHVATPEWQDKREKWLRQKSFGRAANAANMQASLKEHAIKEPRRPSLTAAVPPKTKSEAEIDAQAVELASRVERKDVAAAMALWL